METYNTLELTREGGSSWITLNRLEWEASAIAMAVSTPEAREAFAAFKAQKAR